MSQLNGGVDLVKKGVAVELNKFDANLKILNVALGWDVNQFDGSQYDLDATVFCLNAQGQIRTINGQKFIQDMIFYGNLEHPSGAVKHSGDETTGSNVGDDEVITISLSQIPTDVEKIVGVITIYEGQQKGQTFGKVRNAYVRVDNAETGRQLFKVDLTEERSGNTAIEAFEVYKYNGQWRFKALGDGFVGGLAMFCQQFGVPMSSSSYSL